MAIGSGLLGGIIGGATVSIVIRAVDKFSKNFNRASTGISKIGAVARLGVTAIGVFGIAMVGLGVSTIKAAGDFEQTTIAFETMLGSAEEAQKLLKDLADFARKTPFTLKGVEKNSKLLLAMGIETEDLLPTLKALGDVAAGLSVPLERIALNFGQVKTQGKLTGRELRDFNIAGVPLLDEIARGIRDGSIAMEEQNVIVRRGGKAFIEQANLSNITKKEVAELVSAGKIGFAQVEQAFINMTSEGGRFFNLMEKQSQTALGKFSNLQDAIELTRREIGEALLPIVSEMADTFLEEGLPALKEMIPQFQEFLKTVLEIAKDAMPIMITAMETFFPVLQTITEFVRDMIKAFKDVLVLADRFGGFLGTTSVKAFFGSKRFVGSFQQGGVVPQTGMALVHKGESITPAGQSGGIVINIGTLQSISPEDTSRLLKEELQNKISL